MKYQSHLFKQKFKIWNKSKINYSKLKDFNLEINEKDIKFNNLFNPSIPILES